MLPILRDQLKKHFNEGELRNLCYDLGIDYQELSGDAISDQARELVEYCRRRGHIVHLITKCQQLRPHVEWNNKATINALLITDTSITLMEALAFEISSNMISIQEFVDMGYKVTGHTIRSSEGSNVYMIPFTCMTSVFELAEIKKVLTLQEAKLNDRISKIYRAFLGINYKADALKHAFRPWRAELYIDAVNEFRNELWMDSAQVVEELTTAD
jgi:hypothetical protein